MKIAYVMPQGSLVLTHLAERLQKADTRACGIVQVENTSEEGHRCDMEVQVLPDGPIIPITQSLGKEATGCRLNPSALEDATVAVDKLMAEPFEIFILNKFGEQEANGRGFRDLIAKAIEKEAAILVGTNTISEQAFLDFTGGAAERLEPELEPLMNWLSASDD
ncbi:MAG: DUF2478 domain-containing protein [Cohaesibacter sp.]|nr:DUF2478 domain-containing protein [Cohaesibacter sp.]